jgi:uncharacterized phage-like protein YoqJ
LKSKIEQSITQAIQDGFTHFITGMAEGVDTWAAEILLDLRDNYGEKITIEAAIPCLNQPALWGALSQDRYYKILDKMDKKEIIDGRPLCRKESFIFRNRYMVNNSDRVIAVYDSNPDGGTANCYNYAVQQGKEIVLINEW